MANGQQILSSADQVAYKLLDGQTLTGSGPWVEIPLGLNNKTFSASSLEEGVLDAEIDIFVDGGPDKPSDSSDGTTPIALLTTIQPGDGRNKSPWKFVKAKKKQGTTPIPTTVIMNCAK